MKNYSSTFLHCFYYGSLTFQYGIYCTLLLPLMLLMTTVEQKILFAGFTFICVKLRALLSNGPPSHIRNVRSCKFVLRTCTKNSLSMKLISQKLTSDPSFSMQKIIHQQNGNAGAKFHFFLIYEKSLFLLVCVIERFFKKRIGGHRLSFKDRFK